MRLYNRFMPLETVKLELHRKGIDIAELAKEKEVDLREAFSCWMSRELVDAPRDIHFRRVLCFEPYFKGVPTELVGDIFRSLAPFIGMSPPVRRVAMPLVASGYQGTHPRKMLRLIVEAAVHWISVGLPLTCLKIGCLPGSHVDELRKLFAEIKSECSVRTGSSKRKYKYDIFISYAHADSQEVHWLQQELLKRNPGLKIFIDRKELDTGVIWQEKIFESLEDCEYVVVIYSPSYLRSKMCIEEFNIAFFRQRESEKPIIKPFYLYSAELPVYMKLLQYWDCREFNRESFQSAIDEFLQDLDNRHL